MRKKYSRRKIITNSELKSFDNVKLTTQQYEKLIYTYGEDLTNYTIKLLNDKIIDNKNNKKLVNAKNHYSYFRKDGKLLNFAIEVMNSAKRCGRIIY